MEREERPAHGTTQGGPSLRSDKETALYKHVKFFDRDGDGKVGPLDTYRGFRDIGFGILLSLYAAIVIPLAMGWLTNDKWNWWPSVQIKVRNIHKAKHGSDSQMYDHNGNFRAHEFDQLFDSFDLDGDGKLSFLELFRMTESFRMAYDWFGWSAVKLEWGFLFILCQENGKISRESMRSQYDGSLFYTLAKRRGKKTE